LGGDGTALGGPGLDGESGNLIAFQNQVSNPSAELGTTDIVATGPVIAQDPSFAYSGSNSLKITGSAGITDRVEWLSAAVKATAVPGADMAFSLFARGPTTGNILYRLGVRWYDELDALISEPTGANVTLTTNQDWTRHSLVVTAPSGAASAVPNILEVGAGIPNNRSFWVDAVMFNGGPLIDYFDGDSPGGAWDGGLGSEHADTSNIQIKKVFENPPNGIAQNEWPCFIIWPPALETDRRPGGWRVKNYTVRLTCVVADAELERANAYVDAFREATIDALDVHLRLMETVDIASGPRIEEATTERIGGRAFTAFDAFLTVRVSDTVTYGS
jgi:hypothetical protein